MPNSWSTSFLTLEYKGHPASMKIVHLKMEVTTSDYGEKKMVVISARLRLDILHIMRNQSFSFRRYLKLTVYHLEDCKN